MSDKEKSISNQETPKKSRLNKNKKKVKIKFRHKHPILFTIFIFLIFSFFLGIFSSIIYVQDVLQSTPTVNERMLQSDNTSNIYDKNGEMIASLSSIKQDYISIDDVPKNYIDFLLSVEDNTFYETNGYSPKGLANAFISVVKSKLLKKGEVRGGSTIDQQLIKNTVFSSSDEDRTINRKIQEIWLSTQLNKNYSKNQILEWYINKINTGENSYGANTISITYYNKKLSELNDDSPETMSKLAIIAGLGQAPSEYNLYDNPKLVKKRRDIVLETALNSEKITQEQLNSIKEVDVLDGLQERNWRTNILSDISKKYNDYVVSTKNQVEKMGYNLEEDSIQIYTSLDKEKYDWLLDVAKKPEYFKDDGQEMAATVVDVKTGYVIAQVGGRNLSGDNQYNRAIQNTRSSGSSIKPFLDYGPAIEYLNLPTNYMLDSSDYVYPGTNLVARNFGGTTYGMVDMQRSLRMSLNTTTIRLLDLVGPDKAKAFMDKNGFSSLNDLTYEASEALGVNSSTEQLAYAFAGIANGGTLYEPSYVTKLVFSDGSEKEINPISSRSMSESTAFILTSMLKGVTQPTMSAQNSAIEEFKGMIAKTGTVGYDKALGMPNDSASDVWMNGATKSIAVSIWMGYDNPNEPNNFITGTGASKQEIYKDIMRHYNTGLDTSDWVQPNSVSKLDGDGINAHYVKLDTHENKTDLPTYSINDTVSNLLNVTNIGINNSKVNIPTVPESYVKDGWLNSLSEEDKNIYNYWKSNDYNDGFLPINNIQYLNNLGIFKNN